VEKKKKRPVGLGHARGRKGREWPGWAAWRKRKREREDGPGQEEKKREREKEMHLNLKYKLKWKTSNKTMHCSMKCTRPIFPYISFYG
jgi:hypothetical protein